MLSSPRIMIVEDDQVQRDFLHLVVSRFFPTARVTTVATGYDALLAYQAGGSDLLILDHHLPDVLGSALLDYLRDTGVVTPTILVSGVLPRDAIPRDARTSVMHKPVLLPEFVSTMTHFLTTTSVIAAAA